jgi:hypothetical protein
VLLEGSNIQKSGSARSALWTGRSRSFQFNYWMMLMVRAWVPMTAFLSAHASSQPRLISWYVNNVHLLLWCCPPLMFEGRQLGVPESCQKELSGRGLPSTSVNGTCLVNV